MKMFYGWKMVMAASGLQIIQAMMLHQAFGAYVAVLAVEQGWSKTAFLAHRPCCQSRLPFSAR